MSIVYVVLAVLRVLDALRARAALRGLPTVDASSAPGGPDDGAYEVWLAPGVTVSAEARRAAAAYATAQGLDVVDLIPERAPAHRLLLFAATKGGPNAKRPFAPFRGAGYAVLASKALVARSGRDWPAPVDPAAAVSIAERLARYAGSGVGWAVLPGLEAPSGAPHDGGAARLALWQRLFSAVMPLVVGLLLAFHVAGLVAPWHASTGWLLLAALHLHGLIALAGAPVRARDLAVHTLLRTPVEILSLLRIALAWRPAYEPPEITARRAAYRVTGDLLEARRPDCPLCAGTQLSVYHVSGDLVQDKPGRFVLERCGACGHIFQNPRLSPAGFAYYYGDAYDGLAEDVTELAFGALEPNYQARARSVEGLVTPTRWLDVGGGHGHFCASARRRFPGVRFEGLDLSESIVDAERRGWIDRAHRGLFPDVAPAMRASGERFDVVSMSHYLEHTIDPIAELRAANSVLTADGVLMVEVPDPASRIGRLFGSLWVPLLQPQHLNFVSAENMDRILRAQGFEPVRWHHGEAHMFGDFLGIAWRISKVLAPPTAVPWRPAVGTPRALVRAVVRVACLPLMLVAGVLDVVLTPLLLRRKGWSNTYRVVARKVREIDVETAAAA